MNKELIKKALVKFISGILMCALLIFLPAGSLKYPNGILFMVLLFIPMLSVGIYLLAKCPQLLEKRLNSREQQGEQRRVIALSVLMFTGGFVSAGLDFRFEILPFPRALVIIASAVFLISYLLYFEVMRENVYLSRTVEVQKDQKLVDSGLYSVVRHPMYSVTVLLFLSIPLVLGSWISLLFFLGYPFILIRRIKNEEKVLSEGLEGYRDYMSRVKYRLIPFIW